MKRVMCVFFRRLPQEPSENRPVDDSECAAIARLTQFAISCRQFSPVVGIVDAEPPRALWLDFSGCERIYPSDETLAHRVRTFFAERGCEVDLSFGETPAAAFAFASQPEIQQLRPSDSLLSSLPIETLRIDPKALKWLHELGLHRVGQVRTLPRRELPSRFGERLLLRLDQLFGDRGESITPILPAEFPAAVWSSEHGIFDREHITQVVEKLLAEVISQPVPTREAPAAIELSLETEREMISEPVGTVQPSAEFSHWRELLAVRLERLKIADPVIKIHLAATAMASLQTHARDLFGEEIDHNRDREFSRFVDRMSSRLGSRRVFRPQLIDDWQPENAWQAGDLKPKAKEPGHGDSHRPLRLKRRPVGIDVTALFPAGPPERMVCRGESHRVARHCGPERLETGWWRGPFVRRDYYRIETDAGRRFWVFRNGEGHWFLHGEFD